MDWKQLLQTASYFLYHMPPSMWVAHPKADVIPKEVRELLGKQTKPLKDWSFQDVLGLMKESNHLIKLNPGETGEPLQFIPIEPGTIDEHVICPTCLSVSQTSGHCSVCGKEI